MGASSPLLLHGPKGCFGHVCTNPMQAAPRVRAGALLIPHRSLGATTVIDYQSTRCRRSGPTDRRGHRHGWRRHKDLPCGIIKPGGILVSVVAAPLPERQQSNGVRAVLLLGEVTTGRLDTITALCDRGKLTARVETLPAVGTGAYGA